MWHEIIVALCLVVIIEGILPFLSPRYWRTMMINVARMNDRALRIMGLVSMLVGVGVLSVVNG
jgi:uncharacterized protein YjeT (DUF2065 family)